MKEIEFEEEMGTRREDAWLAGTASRCRAWPAERVDRDEEVSR